MTYRFEFIFAHGKGPHACHFCGEPVVVEQPYVHHPEAFVVHHLDWDRSNNALENLVATQSRCHTDHHAVERANGRRGAPTHIRAREADREPDPQHEQWRAEEEEWVTQHPEAGPIALGCIDEILTAFMIVRGVAEFIADEGEPADLVLMDYMADTVRRLRRNAIKRVKGRAQ